MNSTNFRYEKVSKIYNKHEFLDQIIQITNQLKETENPVTQGLLEEILLKNVLTHMNHGFPEKLHITSNERGNNPNFKGFKFIFAPTTAFREEENIDSTQVMGTFQNGDNTHEPQIGQ